MNRILVWVLILFSILLIQTQATKFRYSTASDPEKRDFVLNKKAGELNGKTHENELGYHLPRFQRQPRK